jgi:hypothetical protein
VLPNGCLIAPFFWQTHSGTDLLCTPVKTTEVGALSAADMSPVPGGGSDSH